MIRRRLVLMSTEQMRAKIQRAKLRAEKRRQKRIALFGRDGALTLTGIKNKLWSLISFYVRLRDSKKDGGRCLICGINPIQCAYHIIPANEGSAAKWDYEDNIVGACFACNEGERRFRRRYEEKHREIFGDERMDRLELRSKGIVKYGFSDFKELIDEVKKKIENLRGYP